MDINKFHEDLVVLIKERVGLKKSMHRMRDIVGRHHTNIKLVYQKFEAMNDEKIK